MFIQLLKNEFLQKECPVCGKKNWLIGYAPRKVFLDGIPDMPMKKYLKQYCMCPKCGCVYHHNSYPEEEMTKTVRSKEYQDVWHSKLDEAAKKLTLMQFFPMDYCSVSREWAHYYAEIEQHDREQTAILNAIHDILHNDLHDHATLFCETTPQFHMDQRPFTLFDDMYIVDLYRRTQQFDAALQQIDVLRHRQYRHGHPNLMNYLQCEEALIRSRNSQLM